VESRLENYRIRKIIIYYFLEDRSVMITEPKMVNSGTPQGAFLKRQMIIKQDGSDCPFEPTDFCVGLDIGICGRSIRIYDADQYTREFFVVSLNFQILVTDLFTHTLYTIELWTTTTRCSNLPRRQLCELMQTNSTKEGSRTS
jgi:hypothetical protein